jgi:hypothetical protein
MLGRPDPWIVVEGGYSQHQVSALRIFRKNVGAAARAKAPEFTRRRLIRNQIVLAQKSIEIDRAESLPLK